MIVVDLAEKAYFHDLISAFRFILIPNLERAVCILAHQPNVVGCICDNATRIFDKSLVNWVKHVFLHRLKSVELEYLVDFIVNLRVPKVVRSLFVLLKVLTKTHLV